MKNYFLNADAWQLFLMLVIAYPVHKFTAFGHTPVAYGFLVCYFLAVWLGWLYAVGSTANERLPGNLQRPVILLQIMGVVPFVSLGIFVFAGLVPMRQGQIPYPPWWMIHVHFAAIFSIAFCIWYAAKQFTTFRLSTGTSFADYYPAFMGFWFAIIGVWFFQPKIRETLGRS